MHTSGSKILQTHVRENERNYTYFAFMEFGLNLYRYLNWTVSIPLCTCNKFTKLNRLYTTYK